MWLVPPLEISRLSCRAKRSIVRLIMMYFPVLVAFVVIIGLILGLGLLAFIFALIMLFRAIRFFRQGQQRSGRIRLMWAFLLVATCAVIFLLVFSGSVERLLFSGR
jgi:heme O synthase-like polyprenyltransferase